jgi:membrane protease YdiL (CAAX protease family)
VLVAFAALTLALAAAWMPGRAAPGGTAWWWLPPFLVSLAAAYAGGLVEWQGVATVALLAASCRAARTAAGRIVRAAAHTVMLLTAALLLAHLAPGFDNPLVVDEAVLGPGALPYTKYLNLDKGIAGLLLLAVYAPELPLTDEGHRHVTGILWRFAAMTGAALALAFALGYVRFDPKLPGWWPMWTWSMVFLTALPEEAVFRGLLQTWLARAFRGTPHGVLLACVAGGILFGAAHAAGGAAYVLLAAVAGIGYGWIFASTRSIGAAIAAHAGLNAVHFLFFSYPALSR